jgi:hypothetical protein
MGSLDADGPNDTSSPSLSLTLFPLGHFGTAFAAITLTAILRRRGWGSEVGWPRSQMACRCAMVSDRSAWTGGHRMGCCVQCKHPAGGSDTESRGLPDSGRDAHLSNPAGDFARERAVLLFEAAGNEMAGEGTLCPDCKLTLARLPPP